MFFKLDDELGLSQLQPERLLSPSPGQRPGYIAYY